MDIIKRFLDYVSYETTSDEESSTFPSNELELNLLYHLKDQLEEMGLDATFKDGYTYGKLKADKGKTDTLFLMAHVDTSPEASGKNPKPRIEHFDGTPINLGNGKILSIEEFPDLKNSIGHDLIVTDGSTLLGGDDKAGDALIMDLLERLLERGDYPNIIVCFTPDEEIGRGTERIDVDFIKKDVKGNLYAYTVDGGEITEYNDETFNAASAKVHFYGTSVHPSKGKGILVNAQEVLMEFHHLLPASERPELTDGREPYIHLVSSKGGIEEAEAGYILRNFVLEDLERQKRDFYKARDIINQKYGKERVVVTIKDTYYNMKNIISKEPKVTELAIKAYELTGIKFNNVPIRGGTDGASLSYKGIPCPNLPTGGGNFHGVYEYVDIDQFMKCRELLLNLTDLLK